MTKGGTAAMSTIRAGSQAARAAWRSTVSRPAARSTRSARASCLGRRRQAAWIVMVSAGTVLLAAACGMGLAWQVMWWWPAAAAQPGQNTQGQYSRARRAS